MKLVNLNKFDSDDLVPRLEALLENAKEGKIKDFVALYTDENNDTCFCVSYRHKSALRIMGQIQLLQQIFAEKFTHD